MNIDFVKVVSNLMNHAKLSVDEIRTRAHIRTDNVLELSYGNECELNHVEAKLLMSLHFKECEELHGDIFV